MWIANVSKAAFQQGLHIDPGENCIAIQIGDPGEEFPTSPFEYAQITQYEFHDADPQSDARQMAYYEMDDSFNEHVYFTKDQASAIAKDLQYALDNKLNVIVHCHAGLCRSGAVCEVGSMLGFKDVGYNKIPNTHVKSLLLRELGWALYG